MKTISGGPSPYFPRSGQIQDLISTVLKLITWSCGSTKLSSLNGKYDQLAWDKLILKVGVGGGATQLFFFFLKGVDDEHEDSLSNHKTIIKSPDVKGCSTGQPKSWAQKLSKSQLLTEGLLD